MVACTKRLAVGCAVASVLVGVTVSAGPADAARHGPVGTTPARYTPWLLESTPNQQVRELVPCGGRMYAVGTISAVGQGSHTYHPGNAFSFSQTTGAVSRWNPRVNGEVNSIALTDDCGTAYLGGSFSTVHGVAASNIVAVNTTTGAVRTGFRHDADGEVDTVQVVHGRVFAGGTFTHINGRARARLASLERLTGAVTPYSRLAVTGGYPNTTKRVYNSQVSHDEKRMLIEGVFTSVGSRPREQVAVLVLGRRRLGVDRWTSAEFDRACSIRFYVRAGAWSPDDSRIYTASTGERPVSGLGSKRSDPRRGLCDSVAEFPFRHEAVSHRWVNYTGCDSLYGVVADNHAVYVTGHERWANNGHGCDTAGPGAVSRPGLAAINPSTGKARGWNPTRSKGIGGDDMTFTRLGLWVASDNWKNGQAQMCGHQGRHGGICLLPYRTS